MAKKKSKARSRRVPRSSTSRMYGDGIQSVVQTAQATKSDTPSKSVSASVTRTTAVVTEEYGYVLSDLRRLGILSVGTFAVLIILGFIIR